MDVRRKFLDYFEGLGHEVVDSSSLTPQGDGTLLFTNAGMNQFKDVFLGKETRAQTRAASSQKCLRAGGKHNDLENVGYTARHHTFFEMLGNFSFGDYFKAEAAKLAWNFITSELGLDTERLYVTVFLDDDQAYDIWAKDIGVDEKRIFRFGEKDNFWSMGDTGPCGPCSEIFYDQSPDGKLPSIQEFEDQDDRFMEIWNLVFMQYMQHADGRREALPKPSIDTGMGLERITSVLEGKTNNYDTSLFAPILKVISEVSGHDYQEVKDGPVKTSMRVLADHIRAICFLIIDDVKPSKDGRGYVLRRIMRRAMRHGKKIGMGKESLSVLVPSMVDSYADAYPTLEEKKSLILNVVNTEQELFSQTVDRGMDLLSVEVDKVLKQGSRIFPGQSAFHLYDTFGFPVDMTADVLREHGLTLDKDGYKKAFAAHKEKAKGTWKKDILQNVETHVSSWIDRAWQTKFLGYESLASEGTVLALIAEDGSADSLQGGQTGLVLLDQTPFYGESGGQVGDVGDLSWDEGSLSVQDVQKVGQDFVLHRVQADQTISVGQKVLAQVGEQRRSDIKRNHTATHMLHATLKEQLGPHVEQKGSLVLPDRLRFDFTHAQGLTLREKFEIEQVINKRIKEDHAVATEVLPIAEAKQTGAVSMFGEKYGDSVRVLSIGDYSKEFCGGTHVLRTGEIQEFVIRKESSVSAGIRRIEGLTGTSAKKFMEKLTQDITFIASKLGVKPDQVLEGFDQFAGKSTNLQKNEGLADVDDEAFLLRYKGQALADKLGVTIETIKEGFEKFALKVQDKKKKKQQAKSTQVDIPEASVHVKEDLQYILQTIEIQDPKNMRNVADRMMEKIQDGMVILGAKDDQKAYLVVKVSKAFTQKYHAGNLVKIGAAVLGGSGGGRPDFAQAGGPSLDKLEEALTEIKDQL